MIVSGAVQLVMIRRAHDSAPVLEFQERMTKLRRVRIVTGLTLGLPWWIMWVAVVLAIAEQNGVDLYAHQPAWIWWNLAVGAVGMLICWWIARRFQGHPVASPVVRAVRDSLTGRNFREVADELREIDQFGEEAAGGANRS